jgi:hypothetical protein
MGGAMDNIEQAFQDVEGAANSASKASNDLAKLANQMKKAAMDGNINGIRRASERMNDLLSSVRQEVGNAIAEWSYPEEEEEQYLKDHYADELTKAANVSGLTIHERDGQLISHPSIIRVLPGERSVRIDRKKISAIRPSRLVEMLVENQKKKPRFSPERFLEAIYKAYALLAGEDDSAKLIKDGKAGAVVLLVNIYDVFTSLPGSTREYDQTDFARDIYFLDTSSVNTTKSGARVSFPSSTGSRGSRTLSFVGPDGEQITYYGVTFSGSS